MPLKIWGMEVKFYISEISGSHGSKYEDGCLSGVALCSLVEVIDVSEVLAVSIISGHEFHHHCHCENLKSHHAP
jgi:hypothetical protein